MTSFHPLSIAALLACSCVAIACGGDSTGKPGGSECALLAAYEDRLMALEGPLGCTSTETLTPDPPGGCEGAKQLVMEMRANLAANLEENGCSSEPPDLTALVADYEARFAAENPFTEHTVERDGFAIAAREYGVQHAGDSPTIVLMHGVPDSQTLYDLVAPALGETHHTVTFDFVGWGRSESPSDPATLSFDGLRRDLEAVLDYFSPIQVVPVVHDLSSWPGIDWALDNPESVRTLVILNATYHPVTGTQPPYVIRALMAADVRPQFLELLGDDQLLQRSLFQAQVGRFFERDDLRATYLPLHAHQDTTVGGPSREALAAVLLETIVTRLAEVPRMATYDRPVSIIFGAEDPTLNIATANAFHEIFPNSTLELIDGANHYVQYDAHERVAELIQAAATP